MRIVCFVLAGLWLLAAPSALLAQSAVLQGGPWGSGHVPVYFGQGQPTPVVIDGGPAGGGNTGVGIGELNVTAQGTGPPPYAAQGSGPAGTISCLYDAPQNNPAGFHYMCFSANAQGGPLIVTGYGGNTTALPFQFIINGVAGVTCAGSPTTSFASQGGIVTHC